MQAVGRESATKHYGSVSLESEEIQLFLHVTAAIVALGVTFVWPFLMPFAERQGVAATKLIHRFYMFLDKYLVIPGAALVFLFGLGLVFSEDHLREDPPAWLWASIIWFVAAFVVAAIVQRPLIASAARTLEGADDSGELPAAYRPAARRAQIVGMLLALSVVAITFLMTVRPS